MKQTDVIRRAVITEKASVQRENKKILVLEVAKLATKVDIKNAVEQLLHAKVSSVRTAISHGKVKRQGQFFGQRSDWKKAYVRLRPGENIPADFEGT